MNVDTTIITLVIIVGAVTSVWSIYDYVSAVSPVHAQEIVQEEPFVPISNQDMYVPSSAPTGVCNGGAGGGGCGCGG